MHRHCRTLLLLLLLVGSASPLVAQAGPRMQEPVSLARLQAPGFHAAELAPGNGTLLWALPLGGAVVGGVVGFMSAAPDCLDGSTGCGNRPLYHLLIGSALGAALGWAVGVMVER